MELVVVLKSISAKLAAAVAVPITKCDLGKIEVPNGNIIVPPLDKVLPGFAFGFAAVAIA